MRLILFCGIFCLISCQGLKGDYSQAFYSSDLGLFVYNNNEIINYSNHCIYPEKITDLKKRCMNSNQYYNLRLIGIYNEELLFRYDGNCCSEHKINKIITVNSLDNIIENISMKELKVIIERENLEFSISKKEISKLIDENSILTIDQYIWILFYSHINYNLYNSEPYVIKLEFVNENEKFNSSIIINSYPNPCYLKGFLSRLIEFGRNRN